MDEYRVSTGPTDVSAILTAAPDPVATLVFGHGAGADMRHANMQSIAVAFCAVGISVLCFNFPFKEAGKSRVDSKAVSTQTIADVLADTQRRVEGRLLLGGHSFGGRMATHAVVDHGLRVDGMIFGSFPLHMAKKPATARADHLDAITCPMLFLSGSRDAMADPSLMNEVIERLGPRATLQWLDTADHGYKVLKRSRARQDDVFSEMAGYAREFIGALV